MTPTVDRLCRTITHPRSVPARDTGVQDFVNDAHRQALRPCSAATTPCIIENQVGWPSNVPPVTVSRLLVRRLSRTIAVSLRSPHSVPPPKSACRYRFYPNRQRCVVQVGRRYHLAFCPYPSIRKIRRLTRPRFHSCRRLIGEQREHRAIRFRQRAHLAPTLPGPV